MISQVTYEFLEQFSEGMNLDRLQNEDPSLPAKVKNISKVVLCGLIYQLSNEKFQKVYPKV